MFGKISCSLSLITEDIGLCEYKVNEWVHLGEAYRVANLEVMFNVEMKEVNYNCQLFESRGSCVGINLWYLLIDVFMLKYLPSTSYKDGARMSKGDILKFGSIITIDRIDLVW